MHEAGRYESTVDRQIREAQERGDFDDLPGKGKPLPGAGEHYDEDWWLKGLIHREKIAAVLPPALALRKEAEDLTDKIAKLKTEAAVRALVADLNERIRRARVAPVEGPPVTQKTIDVEEAVRTWRES